MVAEYNHSITRVLKYSLDQAYNEWTGKPFTAVGYGGIGAARAIEHLRLIAVKLQMVSTHTAVHIGDADIMTLHRAFGKKPIEEIEATGQSCASTCMIRALYKSMISRPARRSGLFLLSSANSTAVGRTV